MFRIGLEVIHKANQTLVVDQEVDLYPAIPAMNRYVKNLNLMLNYPKSGAIYQMKMMIISKNHNKDVKIKR